MSKANIGPFMLIEHDDSTSVILCVGEYRHDIFLEREEEGFVGSGYDWASLASVFLDERMPELAEDVRMDPEGDMFCAFSKNRAALRAFVVAFHAMCEDVEAMRSMFSRAELD